jgi:hypothetical protein
MLSGIRQKTLKLQLPSAAPAPVVVGTDTLVGRRLEPRQLE